MNIIEPKKVPLSSESWSDAPAPRTYYRADLDGLRAFAVVSVLLFHAFPRSVPWGFLGVDMFFVISGFLITGIIVRDLPDGHFSFAHFYARRIRRLFPALITVCASVLSAGWFLLLSKEYLQLGKHVGSAAVFLSNATLTHEVGAGYFDIASNLKPLLHLWSLGIEEQFYLLFPAVLVFLWSRVHKAHLLEIIALLAVVSFLANYSGLLENASLFYSPLTRFWEIFCGCLLALFMSKRAPVHPTFSNILSFVGAVLTGAALFFTTNSSYRPELILLAVLGTLLLISAGPNAFLNKHILSQPGLVGIGLISYPLYLWHWPLLSFARIINAGEPATEAKLILVGISFILAALTCIFIENPLRKNTSKPAILYLLLCMLLLGALGWILFLKEGIPSRLPFQEQIAQTIRRGNGNDDICLKKFPQDIFKKYCLIEGTGDNYIFILGDSHAEGIFTAYHASLVALGYTPVLLAFPGCPYLIPNESKKQSKEMQKCNENFREVLPLVASYNPKAIILSNNGWTYRKNFLEDGMMATLSQINQKTKIIWFLQNPRPPFDPMKCLSRPLRQRVESSECFFPRRSLEEVRLGYAEIVERITEKYPALITLDPSEAICDRERCTIESQSIFFYADISHLSISGGKILAEKFPLEPYFPSLSR